MDQLNPVDSATIGIDMRPSAADFLKPGGKYKVECIAADGFVRWAEDVENLITDEGARDILDKYFSGNNYNPSFVMGLMAPGTPAVGDTQASHPGWNEVGGANAPVYTGNRKVPIFGANASGRTKTTSAVASFAITTAGPTNVGGFFINSGGSTTKDDTSGKLLSAGAFTNGTRAAYSGDTINVTYSLTL